jgi:hypothetical protein
VADLVHDEISIVTMHDIPIHIKGISQIQVFALVIDVVVVAERNGTNFIICGGMVGFSHKVLVLCRCIHMLA